MRASVLTRAQVRSLIDEVLRTDADLDAFCLDYFPEVHKRCSSSMQRTEKVSLLLSLEPDLQFIVDRLSERVSGGTLLPKPSPGTSRNASLGRKSSLGVLILALSALFLGGVLFGRGSGFVTSPAEDHGQSTAALRAEATGHSPVDTTEPGPTAHGLIAGVWYAGSGDEVLWQSDLRSFLSKWQELSAHKLRLVDLKVRASLGMTTQYTGLWRSGDDPHYLLIGLDWEQFRQQWKALSAQNLRLVDLEVYSEDGITKFAGVWRSGSDGQELLAGLDSDHFKAQWKTLSARGLRLVDIEVYAEDGEDRFAGIWRSGQGEHAFVMGIDEKAFLSQWSMHNARHHRLVDLEIHSHNGSVRYTAVWSGTEQSCALYVTTDRAVFGSVWRSLFSQGLRLGRIESYSLPASSIPTWPVTQPGRR